MAPRVPRALGRDFCQAEVQDLDASIGGHHDVGWLEITVHDALLVRRRQRVGHRDADLEDPCRPDSPPARNQPVERLAFDDLHREEVDAVCFFDRSRS